MKKFIAGLAAAALLVLPLSGCGGGKEAKTGLAVMISNSDYEQKAPEEGKDGVLQVTAFAAGALVDNSGKVIKMQLDVVQSKFDYTAEGKVKTTADTVFKTKKDLGPEYNMKPVSGIGKEWNEQAEAFEEYVKGKTADEIRGIAVEKGVPTDEDLKSSVTVNVENWKEVAARAVENAKAIGAKADDKLGLGLYSTAEQTKEDSASQYNHYTVITLDKDNKITSSVLDASIAAYGFADGKLADDIHKEVKTKQVLKEDYGMKGASPIGKEWNEQADAFAAWTVGKTPSEVEGVAVDENNHPTDEDLKTSVTVNVNGFQAVYAKAGASAK